MDPDARVWPALKTRQGSGQCAASVYSLSVPVNYPQRTGGGGDGVGCAASDGSLMVPGSTSVAHTSPTPRATATES